MADGSQVYGGLQPGSELNWKMLVGGPGPFHVNEGYFRAFVYQDMNWDFHNFDLERDLRLAVERTGAVLDANDPNLKPFKDTGGKLIMYQAWNENSTPPGYIQEYYKNVEKAMGVEARHKISHACSWWQERAAAPACSILRNSKPWKRSRIGLRKESRRTQSLFPT